MRTVDKPGLWMLLSAVGSLCSEVLRLGNESFHAHLKANPLALVACKSLLAKTYLGRLPFKSSLGYVFYVVDADLLLVCVVSHLT